MSDLLEMEDPIRDTVNAAKVLEIVLETIGKRILMERDELAALEHAVYNVREHALRTREAWKSALEAENAAKRVTPVSGVKHLP